MIFNGFGERPVRAFWICILYVFAPFILTFITPIITLNFDSVSNIVMKDVVNSWLRCIPFIRDIPGEVKEIGTWGRIGTAVMQILIALQAALFGFALRNKFRR